MFNVLPLFSSTYSIGRSILTLEDALKEEEKKKIGKGEARARPISIFDICLDSGLKDLFLVENNLSGFARALKGCKKNNLNLYFGLKLIICENMEDRTPESISTEHKIILITKNDNGYKRLLNIYSKAATDGLYFKPRIDCVTLERYFNQDDLFLVYPFYNSFLHKNTLYFSRCMDCNFAPKNFLIEDNDLPFNYLISEAIDKYSKKEPIQKIPCKSIFYKDRKDFKSYITYRALMNRGTLEAPNIEHLASSEFCFESWKELENRAQTPIQHL